MLNDTIDLYKEYLSSKFTTETTRTYMAHIKPLLAGQNLNFRADKLDIDKVIAILTEVKYKNNFAKYKNAFLHFCEFLDVTLNDDYLNQIKELEKGTKKKYRKSRNIDFESIDKKIKGLRNQKLKLSYQTMLATGLRVAELAQITKDDCLIADDGSLITDDEICLSFIAKGGMPSTVTILKSEHPKLFGHLKALIKSSKHKIFYSAIYLQINAKELGFTCHDLRRIYAKLEYQKAKAKRAKRPIKDKGAKEVVETGAISAKEVVRDKLRHSSIKNTNIYLKSKVKV